MRALLKLSEVIDAINVRIGRWLAWLVLVALAALVGGAAGTRLRSRGGPVTGG